MIMKGEAMQVWGQGGIWEISGPLTQFYYKTKTPLKKKSTLYSRDIYVCVHMYICYPLQYNFFK